MKTNTPTMDTVIYIFMCLFSLGVVFLLRVLISMAIRQSFKEE